MTTKTINNSYHIKRLNTPSPPHPQPANQNNIHIDQNTLELIDRVELQRQWGPHLVPLQFIVQRTIAQVFHSMQIAAQPSPGDEDHQRRKRLVEKIVQWRRQLIKLLVLVKWSSNSTSVHKIMSIVAFLQRQNSQFERTVNILRASKENFHSARMRNYDIPTALQVLTNRHPILPGQLMEQFGSKPRLSDEEVIDIMHELNQLIRYRLASHEVIPKDFRSYRICDGRVFFKVDKMFECSLTVGGGQLDSRWFLLHVEFLFKVTSPRGKDFLPIPQGPVNTQIVECGNVVMAPSILPTESSPDPKPPERPIMKVFAYLRQSKSRDLIIYPLFYHNKDNVRDLCLNYQLEALHYQASQLERSAWAKHTRLSIPTDRSTLTILYWTHARPVNPPFARPGQTTRNLPQPTPLGSLTVRRHVERHGQSRMRVLNFLNGYPSLPTSDQTSSPDGYDDEDFGATCTERLQTIWRPIEVSSNPPSAKFTPEELENLKIREGKELVFLKENEKGAIELEVAMNELSLEDILQRVVRIHTDCIMRRVFFDLIRLERPSASGSKASPTPLTPYFRSIRLIPWENNSTLATRYAKSIEVVLHARHAVELSIDEFSGRFRLQSVVVPGRDHVRSNKAEDSESIDRKLRTDCLGGFNSVNMLSSSANSINFNPSGLRDVLARLKSDILLDQIELKTRILGIRTTRNLPISIQQITVTTLPPSLSSSTTSPSHSLSPSIMYCKLSRFSYYYLLIQVTEIGIRCALILVDHRHTLPRTSNNSFWDVRQILELQIPSFVGDSDDDGGVLDHFTLSRAQIQHMYHHSLIQVTLSRLMEGLRRDGISYEQLLPLTPKIIKQQQQSILDGKHPRSSSKMMERFPQLHSSFEVVGLLTVPLLGFLNPTLVTQKNLFGGQNLAVKVFIQPNSYFGVQVEIRFKFNSEKIKSEELEEIMRSKQTNLNLQILSSHTPIRSNSPPPPPTPKPAELTPAPATIEEEEEDDDDEEPLSKRIQHVKFVPVPTSNLGIFSQPPQLEREEEEEEIQHSEDDDFALDSKLVDSTDWSIDSINHQFIFMPSFFHFSYLSRLSHDSSSNLFTNLYLCSIRKFFNLIHTSSVVDDVDDLKDSLSES